MKGKVIDHAVVVMGQISWGKIRVVRGSFEGGTVAESAFLFRAGGLGGIGTVLAIHVIY